VFQKKAMSCIFGPRGDEVTEVWRKLQDEELRDLYSSPSIIRIIKSKRMRWEGMWHERGRKRSRIVYWWESHRERDL
jgi:hypothetical protein